MIGEMLGSYRVVAKLGEGGMGAVYVGEHAVLGRRVAIKLLLPALSSNQELVKRFFNEARATAMLDHPGLVQVFDFGQTPSGSAFLVMELLTGESLAGRLTRLGKLDHASAAGFCRQATAAVGTAHAVGIVHRDLKPDNLFLVRDAEVAMGERVKVLDFGIAKLTDTGPDGLSMTRTGTMLGTPAYMSPEQCRGAGEVDLRSDIYSLGCILFEMVCGRPPFAGAGTGEIIGAHIFQAFPAPRTIDPGIPPALEAIIARALDKEPRARQQSMQQLGAELEDFLTRSGLRASAPGVAPAAWPAPPSGGAWGAPAPYDPSRQGLAAMPPGSTPTTLGAATGQRAIATTRRRGWVAPVVVAAAIGVAIASVGYAVSRDNRPTEVATGSGPTAPAPTPTPTAPTPTAPTPTAPTPTAPTGPTPTAPTGPTPTAPTGPTPTVADSESPRALYPKTRSAAEVIKEREGDATRPRSPTVEPTAVAVPPASDKRIHVTRRPASKTPPLATSVKPALPSPERSAPVPPPPPPEPAAIAPTPFAMGQIWSGRYLCGQGETGLRLRITGVRDDMVQAVFEFSHPGSGASGSYTVSGRYDPRRRTIALAPGSWLRHPVGYEMVGMAGTVSSDGSTFAGSITYSACSTFTVRR